MFIYCNERPPAPAPPFWTHGNDLVLGLGLGLVECVACPDNTLEQALTGKHALVWPWESLANMDMDMWIWDSGLRPCSTGSKQASEQPTNQPARPMDSDSDSGWNSSKDLERSRTYCKSEDVEPTLG